MVCGGQPPGATHQRWLAMPPRARPLPTRRAARGGKGGCRVGLRRRVVVRKVGVVNTRCAADHVAVIGDVVTSVGSSVVDAVASHLPGNTLADSLREPDTFNFHHTHVQTFPGLQAYASVGFHFNIPAVLAATCVFSVAGVLVFSRLWERVWKETVFGREEQEPEPNILCGVDCSAYPILANARVTRAAAFAERWHHGQYRRNGDPYVVHCVEAARILAALLPPASESRKYVDAVVACILHDVVDDTECDIEDVRAEFGARVAKLVSDVSTLGKLPQYLRRWQRQKESPSPGGAAEGAEPAEDIGGAARDECLSVRFF